MDYSEKWGKDVDEAVRLALLELKVSIDEVDVIVLEESSKGFFGLGSKLAKVRVEKKKDDAAKKETKEVKETKDVKEANDVKETKEPKENIDEKKKQQRDIREHKSSEKQNEKRVEKKETREPQKRKRTERLEIERPENLVPTTDHPALLFITALAEKMELSLEVTAKQNEESLYIDIEGADSGTVIGKRGQTLDSIQYLASLVANKGKENYLRVVVDAENYRRKREKTLEQLAERLAGKVIKTKKTVRLEPMNPYERKVIHAKLQENGKVTTRSEGEEPYRRVVIELK